MVDAENNAEEALSELKQAAKHQKTAGKCLKCLVCIIIMGIIVGGFLLWYFLFNK
jgi:t-SNARE complex subunit (syntaxin)